MVEVVEDIVKVVFNIDNFMVLILDVIMVIADFYYEQNENLQEEKVNRTVEIFVEDDFKVDIVYLVAYFYVYVVDCTIYIFIKILV